MTASRHWLCAPLIAWALLAGQTSAAQTPRPLLPEPGAGAATSAPTVGIDVRPLADPDPAAAGISRSHDLSPRVAYDKSEPRRLRAILEHLPRILPSGAVRARLVARIAAPWPGATGGKDLVRARAEALLRLGAGAEAAELAMLVEGGAPADDVSLRLLAVEGLAMAAEAARACRIAEPLPADLADVVAIRFACALLAGDTARAALALDLARERGIVLPADFESFAAAALAASPLPMELPEDGTRAARLLLLATRPVAIDSGLPASAPAPLLQAVALNPEVPAELRLQAAERAAVAGFSGLPERLAAAPETSLSDDPLLSAQANGPTGRRAMLDAIAAEQIAAARATRLQRAVPMVAAGVERVYWLERLAPAARELPVDRTLLFALDGILPPLLAAGLFERASEWLRLAATAADMEPAVNDTIERLHAALTLAGLAAPTAIGRRPWAQRAILLALLRGLGSDVDSEAWTALLEEERMGEPVPPPSVSLWYLAGDAAATGRSGEAALAAYALLAPAVEAASPVALARSLAILRDTGAEQEARLLAVAVALALRL